MTTPLPPGRRPGGAQIIPRPELWTTGPPAPWIERHPQPPQLSVAEVLRAIDDHRHPRPFLPGPGDRPSAVLVALVDGPEGAEVVLTRRSWQLTNHKGEISFPGGRMDPGETPMQTALREAWEEILLDPGRVAVHGELDHHRTFVSRSYIVPVVGTLDERPDLRPGTGEVERILFVPLAELARADTHREEIWHRPDDDFSLQFFELDDETIWGATGRMLYHLLELVYS
ncbi:MAG: CoA pyrophosphatase [Ilumatobacteraceae bacterium]